MVVIIFLGLAILLILALDTSLRVVRYKIPCRTPAKGTVRLAQISDLHAFSWGKGQQELLTLLQKEKPDALLITGDVCNTLAGMAPTLAILEGMRLPCFYVSGNHEEAHFEGQQIKEVLRAYGVTVLEGRGCSLTLHGRRLWIAGVDDPVLPGYRKYYEDGWRPSRQEQAERILRQQEKWQEALRAMPVPEDRFSILLTHRPEEIPFYRQLPYDLVLAGHAHGGQVRLPGLINGLFAPMQGVFPPYAGGLYTDGRQTEIVSRGLKGSTLLLPRIFNHPELVMVELVESKERGAK